MKNLLKYTSIILLFMLVLSTISFASDINMNLGTNTISSTSSSAVNNTNEISNDTTPLTTSSNTLLETSAPTTTYTTVSGSSNMQDDGLTLTNIINIFVVVVGIVLVLLGLAILIRLKY